MTSRTRRRARRSRGATAPRGARAAGLDTGEVVEIGVVDESLPPMVAGRPVTRSDLTWLYRQHYDQLVRMASMLLNDVSASEEVVQDAFVKMFALADPPSFEKAPAYLRSVVLNGARSQIRKIVVRRRQVVERPTAAAAAEFAGLERVVAEEILAEVRSLPRRQAEVLLLRYYLDLSEHEIAETLEISPGSVKTHASRGIAKLGRLLEDSQ